MSDLKEFHNIHGMKVCIPLNKITGFTEAGLPTFGKCFIATGADDSDGGENGWYVIETYDEVKAILEKGE